MYISSKDLDNAYFNLMSMRDLMLNEENFEEVEKIEKLLNAMVYGMTVKQWHEIKEIVLKREMLRDKTTLTSL